MLTTLTKRLKNSESLQQAESHAATLNLLLPQTPTEQIAEYLLALHNKGETTAEILGVISALQQMMITVPTQRRVLDIVGTGGDRAATVNISTAAAILAASCGVSVVKHGNRAVSSLAGSADVLEAIGIPIQQSPAAVADCLEALNIAFCFAPQFHPALAQLRDIRRTLGVPTIFNLVGPFLNPARAQHYLLGVFTPTLLPTFADVLSTLNVSNSVVVHSDGLDEISCSAITQIVAVDKNRQHSYTLNAEQLGFKPHSRQALTGGNAVHNAEILLQTLQGKSGPVADACIINAAMAIYIYGVTPTLLDAVTLAKDNLTMGAGFELIQRWKAFFKRKSS